MRTLAKITLFIIISIVIFFAYVYYALSPVEINNAQTGDELIKNGDSVYVEKKSVYKKGDIILINQFNQCTREKISNPSSLSICNQSSEQATRIIDGLPEGTVNYTSDFSKEFEDFLKKPSGRAFVLETKLKKDQYSVRFPISKKELVSSLQDLITTQMIYGEVIAIPSRGWNEKWRFLKSRTLYFPKFIQRKFQK